VLDDLSTGHAEAVPAGAPLVRGRIHDAIDDVLTPEFDGVLHFAAFMAAGESVQRPDKYWSNNAVGSLRLLDAMRAVGVRRLVFSSTANVYGDPDASPIPETAATRPPNPYAASKLAVDHALAGEATAYGLAAVSLRYFNVAGAHYGAGAGPAGIGERHDPETHLIPIALQVAAGSRDKLQLFGDDYPTPDGTCVRDYIHVEDLARAHLSALDYLRAGGASLTANCGYGHGYSVREIISSVEKVAGVKLAVREEPRRAGDPPSLVAKTEKVRTVLGWQPQLDDIDTIVRTSLEWERRLQKEPW
jgi:UDP-glucose 4-epimerase